MRDPSFEQRCVDDLTFTGLRTFMQGSQNAHGQEKTGRNVGYGRTDFRRRGARSITGDAHKTAHTLGNEVKTAPAAIGARDAKA